jgi:hypothetical protein
MAGRTVSRDHVRQQDDQVFRPENTVDARIFPADARIELAILSALGLLQLLVWAWSA